MKIKKTANTLKEPFLKSSKQKNNQLNNLITLTG